MKKFLIVLMSLILLFLLAYYIKSQLRIDVYKSFGISEYLPFKYFQADPNPILANPQVGILLRDGFEVQFWSETKWADLWAREEDLVESDYNTDGVDGSQCLLIKSYSTKDWAYMHAELISVESGDRFGYEGTIRTEGDAKVILSVQTYNEKMKVITWSYASKTVTAAKNWVEAINEFEIPQDIKYIRFGLKGSGKGRAWIDDVALSKLQ